MEFKKKWAGFSTRGFVSLKKLGLYVKQVKRMGRLN